MTRLVPSLFDTYLVHVSKNDVNTHLASTLASCADNKKNITIETGSGMVNLEHCEKKSLTVRPECRRHSSSNVGETCLSH